MIALWGRLADSYIEHPCLGTFNAVSCLSVALHSWQIPLPQFDVFIRL